MAEQSARLPRGSPFNENLATWANGVTLIRTIVAVVFFSVASIERSSLWNLAGLGVYWALDCLDGFLARALDQETRFGAQMDIISDRFLIAFFYLNHLTAHPELAVVIVLFLFEFMVLDHYLSNQFMRWQLLSPNYFYKVDRTIWWLNWSMPGKFFNSGVVTILLLATNSAWAAWPVLVLLFAVKLYSWVRMHRLPGPLPQGRRQPASPLNHCASWKRHRPG
jgi:CDP-diacylglycerol--glycerol-3-phosphate 3-phosphatidyltransferase